MQENGYFHRMGAIQTSTTGWNGIPGVSTSPIVKKVLRLDVPVDKYPNVCKLLCCIGYYITPAFVGVSVTSDNHGTCPLLSDESVDYYKKQQLRELAILNGTLREESPQLSPSLSPFNSTGMKRAKTGR
ncbi:hypothetical protein GW17_00007911 [Ensete ventricosum]|nr:hypothetical protein GW17_00007911 [Ensete ventricosum]RZR79199.1 hypothetical protein BHM03_00004831 [Ensete ventricosum]